MPFQNRDFLMLKSGRQKFILTLWLVVRLTACVCHFITSPKILLTFDISIIIIIVELYPLFDNI